MSLPMEWESCNQVTVTREALRHNLAQIRRRAGSAGVMAMVKADAYGHGMIETARVCAAEGVEAFGVAELGEAIVLRRAGIAQEIIVLLGLWPENATAFPAHGLTPVLLDATMIAPLAAAAAAAGIVQPLHVKVDAGMGRCGLAPGDIPALLARIAAEPWLRCTGLMAHLPSSEDAAATSTARVRGEFLALLRSLGLAETAGFQRHLANSGGIFHMPGQGLSLVRPGISLYGYHPDGARGTARLRGEGIELRPAMRCATRVIQVKEVGVGAGLGYGHTHVTRRPTTLAVLPIGYDDGYLRDCSNRAQVLLHGCRAPVLGRVSMNSILVDVTDIAGVAVGDEAVVLGRQGDDCVSADELAAWMDTISYEVLCLLGNRNARRYEE
ncbi:MAG: alanine racemase [Desulfobulbaceae bacterium A2]|nr:MAG: alanine racemase [Desulfobulbaceae bacterium A2]